MSQRSLLVVIALAAAVSIACGGGAEPAAQPAPAPATAAEHAHEAPHGGVLVELGDHFGFLEFVLDADTGTLTAYVLDGGAEQAVRIAQPSMSVTFESPATLAGLTLELTGRANVLTGETVGDTSQFALSDDRLRSQTSFAARLGEVVVKGQAFRDLTAKSQ